MIILTIISYIACFEIGRAIGEIGTKKKLGVK